jgi:hypothetical protein
MHIASDFVIYQMMEMCDPLSVKNASPSSNKREEM